MSNNQTLALIETLIQKTKSASITWNKYSLSDYEIKPSPTSSLNENFEGTLLTTAKVLSSLADSAVLDSENSYVAASGDGLFFLLLYRSVTNETLIELRIQTKTSKASKIFASTRSRIVKISSQLKRLYNIVNSFDSTMDIDAFVDNFLKNE